MKTLGQFPFMRLVLFLGLPIVGRFSPPRLAHGSSSSAAAANSTAAGFLI